MPRMTGRFQRRQQLKMPRGWSYGRAKVKMERSAAFSTVYQLFVHQASTQTVCSVLYSLLVLDRRQKANRSESRKAKNVKKIFISPSSGGGKTIAFTTLAWFDIFNYQCCGSGSEGFA